MPQTLAFQVRPFQNHDIPQLLKLMEAHAIFEGTIRQFAVTEQAILDHGLGSNPRFGALVAAAPEENLLGMAVHYVIPWTSDLRPILVLKDLYVVREARSSGVGLALAKALALEAQRIGATRIRGAVPNGNVATLRFCNALGGRTDNDWQSWYLDEAAILSLAAEATRPSRVALA